MSALYKLCLLSLFYLLLGTVFAGETVYRRILDAAPGELDPIYTDNGDEIQIIRQLFDQLVAYDQRLQLTPLLAQQWEVSPDGLKYIFTIKQGVKFTDGHILTPDDIVFSIKRAIGDPASLFFRDFYMIKGAQDYRSGKAKDVSGLNIVNSTVKIELNKPSPYLLSVLASSAASIVRKKPAFEKNHISLPIGTGPFIVESVSSRGVALKANRGYFRGSPKLAKVVYRVYRTKEDMYRDFSDGKLEDIAPYNLLSTMDRNRFKQIFANGIISFLFALNPDQKPLGNEYVRQALGMSVDFDKILAGLHKKCPTLERTKSYIPKGRPGFDPIFTGIEYNPTKARALIQKAGYQDFSDVPQVTLSYSGNLPYSKELLEGIQRYYTAIGLKFTAKIVTSTESATEVQTGRWQMKMIGLDTLYPDSYYLVRYFHSKASNGFVRCNDTQIDALIETLEAEISVSKRQELLRQLNMLITNKAYVIPLYSGDIFDGVFQKWVTGVQYPHTAYFDLPMYPIAIDGKLAAGRITKGE